MRKLLRPYIKTGEFAKMCSTNKRTLFYYDEIGLLRPALTDEKGYRYYSETQSDVFFTIRCLTELGMPLSEIGQYVADRGPEKLRPLLEEQLVTVQAEQERLRHIEQVIRTKLELVRTGEELEERQRASETDIFRQVHEELVPTEWMVLSERLDTDRHETLIRALYRHITCCNREGLSIGHPYGAMIATDAPEGQYAYFMTRIGGEIPGQPCHAKPAGTYAVTYIKGDYYQAEDAFARLRAYCAAQKRQIGPYFYKEAVLDELSAGRSEDYITRISAAMLPRGAGDSKGIF